MTLFTQMKSKIKPKMPKEIDPMSNMGNIPCAAISVLSKSFLESIALYCEQKKESIDNNIRLLTNKEGNLDVELTEPPNDLVQVHRFAIEQMLILGFQSVAKEYPLEIELNIH